MRRRGPGQKTTAGDQPGWPAARIGSRSRQVLSLAREAKTHEVPLAGFSRYSSDSTRIYRPIKRPLFGWGFRLWWQGVCEGLGLAVLVLGSWGGLNLLLEAVKVLG